MITQRRIFIETKPVIGGAGHLYLVFRDVIFDDYGNVIRVVAETDQIIRGGPEGSTNYSRLATETDLLKDSGDRYERSDAPDDTPEDRHSYDITDLLLAAGVFSDVHAAWAGMTGFAQALNEQYRYELPGISGDEHVANSNATILSVLNHAGLDVRSFELENGASYVDSHFAFGHPGADKDAPTLLGTNASDLIQAAAGAVGGLYLLGRNHRHDIFVGTEFADRYYGEQAPSPMQGADYSATFDTVSYAHKASGLTIRLQADTSLVPLSQGPLAIHGVNSGADAQNPDFLYGIEQVRLSGHDDVAIFADPVGRLAQGTLIDGGAGRDRLDFSQAGSGIKLSSVKTSARLSLDPEEAFAAPDEIGAVQLDEGYWIGESLTFTNFEHVIGSSHGDVLDLRNLSPGGALTEAQKAQIAAAWAMPYASGFDDPAGFAQSAIARAQAAMAVPQNQIEVLIEGGAGNDRITGSETGYNIIHGGDGNDRLQAGGFVSELYGGDGDDILFGGGGEYTFFLASDEAPDTCCFHDARALQETGAWRIAA